MSKFLTRLLITTVAVLITSYLLKGIHINDVTTALLVAFVLALLNGFVKPILIIFTIPISIVTLGLFLLVINILMIEWTASLVSGFTVDSWWWALVFSIVLSLITGLLGSLFGTKEKS